MPKDKEIEKRAKRRDSAIEKNKQALLNIIELNEDCKANVLEIQNILNALSTLRENFHFYLDKMLISNSTGENVNIENESNFLSSLGEQISKLTEAGSFLSSRVHSQSGALQRISVLLEIESKETQEAYKRHAESLNILYDESEELWLQILLVKIEERFKKTSK